MERKGKIFKRSTGISAILLLVLLTPFAGQAQTPRYWIGGDGVWSDGTKWTDLGGTPIGVPVDGDSALLNHGGIVSYDIGSLSLGSIRIETEDTPVVLSMGQGQLTTTSTWVDQGTFGQSGGTHTVNDYLGVGTYIGASGTYNLSGNAILVKAPGETMIGGEGIGYFTQSNSSSFSFGGSFYLGDRDYSGDSGGNPLQGYGKYTMTGGTLQNTPGEFGEIVLGEWGGKGEFIQSGGAVTISLLTLGRQPRGIGNYELSGDPSLATLTVDERVVVGQRGTGTFTQDGGTHTVSGTPTVAGDLILGDVMDSTGYYNLYGGSLTVNGVTRVGNDGRGFFHQDGGTFNANEVWVGVGSNANGAYGSYRLATGDLQIDYLVIGGKIEVNQPGVGLFTQEGGSVTAGGLWIADTVGSVGNYHLSEGDLVVKVYDVIGMRGQGTFTQEGGTHTANQLLELGGAPTAKGTYSLSLGDLFTHGTIVGSWGEGELNQSGGHHEVNGDLVLGSEFGVKGTYNLSDGDLLADNTFVGGYGLGVFNQFGGRHYVGVNTDGTIRDGLHELIIGRFGGSDGTYNLSNGELYAAREIVGDAGSTLSSTGTFNQSGDAFHVVSNDLIIGQDSNSTGTFTLAADAQLTVCGNLYLGDEGGTGTFVQSGASSLNVSGNLVIGARSETYGSGSGESVGTFTQTGGTTTVEGDLVLGEFAGTTGTFNLSNGELNASNVSYVGREGIGIFNLTGSGRHNASELIIGYADSSSAGPAGAYGEYNISENGYLGAWQIVIGGKHSNDGFPGYGTLNQNGGTVETEHLWLADTNGSIGTYNLHSGDLTVTGYNVIGAGTGGAGTFNQYGGTHTAGGDLQVGPAGSGTYSLHGGILNVQGSTILGSGGTGVFNQSGGTHTANGGLNLGLSQEVTGTYNLNADDGPALLSVKGVERVGVLGRGTFTQTGGTHTVAAELILGNDPTGDGKYTLSGDPLLSALTVDGITVVGNSGTGEFSQAGGKFISSSLWVGESGPGTYNLSGGTLSIAGNEEIGRNATGLFAQTGGNNLIGNDLLLGLGATGIGTYQHGAGATSITNGLRIGEYAGSRGRYELSGTGSLSSGYTIIGVEGTGEFVQAGGSVTTGGLGMGTSARGDGEYTISNSATLAVNGDMKVGENSLAKAVFTQKDASSVTVTGDIDVGNHGTYKFEGGLLSANRIAVGQGGLFKGSGTISTPSFESLGGTVAPGNSPGSLTISGNYSQDANSILAIELGGTEQGVTYDFLHVLGDASLAGTLQIDLYAGYVPTAGDDFDILLANVIHGEFTSFDGPAGWSWSLAYLDTDSFNGVDTVRLTANAVPIPGAVWLFAPALAALAGLRRRFAG